MTMVRFVASLFVYSLFLLVTPISSEINLNQLFENQCHRPKCTISLSEREYVVTAPINAINWTHFALTAPNHATIRCRMTGKGNSVINVTGTRYFVLENISLVNCSQHKVINSSKDLFFKTIIQASYCYSVLINNCYFPDFLQLGVVLHNTNIVVITNSFFKAHSSALYNRAVTFSYLVADSRNVSFSAHNLTVDGCNMTYKFQINQFLTPRLQHVFVGGALAIFILNASHVHISIKDSKFLNSNALEGGGILIEMWKEVTVYDIHISGCHFENNTAYEKVTVSKGGALSIRALTHRGYAQIKNCTFVSNRARNGGALAVLLYERINDTFGIDISDSGFRNNSADRDAGGAIYAENLYITNNNYMRLWNSTFEYNSANSGGAILAFNFWVLLEDCVSIRRNMAYYGGGVCLLGSGMKFRGRDIVLEDNTARHSGGAIYLHSSSWLHAEGDQTLIQNNTAMVRGGAIFVFLKYPQYEHSIGWNFWLHETTVKELSCFLRGDGRDALIFSNNRVDNFTNLGMGADIYTHSWGGCYQKNERNHLSTRSIIFRDRPDNCSITLDIVEYGKEIHLKSPCHVKVNNYSLNDLHFKCDGTLELESMPNYYNQLKDAIKKHASSIPMNETVHFFFPGFSSNIDIHSFDGLNNSIETLTRVIFKPISSKHSNEIELAVSKSGTNKSFIIKKNSTEKFIFGKICLKSYATLNQVTLCDYAIIGDCPSPLSAPNARYCDARLLVNNGGNIGIVDPWSSSIQLPPGTLLNYPLNTTDKYVFTRCTWFQCRCHISASPANCRVNINAPEHQCLGGLALPFCSKCKEKDYMITPQFNWLFWNDNKCYKCTQPYIMISIYVIITLIFTVLICVLEVDVFSDYTRSIAFYSSTLYLLSVSGGLFMESALYIMLSIPIVVINLLVTHMYSFCLPSSDLISRAIFEMVAPFLFIVYIFIMIIFVKHVPYFSKFGKYDLVNKFWTIIVLTYAYLSNQAFSILYCSPDSNQVMRWLFDGGQKCLHGQHLAASIIAIILLFLLVTFPVVMFFFSRSKLPEYRNFVLIYQERYVPGFKQWEMLKLYLRVLFPLIIVMLPYVLPVSISCSLVSIICLFLMILNSLLQPASNKMANHFESICLLILAFIGFQLEPRAKRELNGIIFIPYIFYLAHLAYLSWKRVRKIFTRVNKSQKK